MAETLTKQNPDLQPTLPVAEQIDAVMDPVAAELGDSVATPKTDIVSNLPVTEDREDLKVFKTRAQQITKRFDPTDPAVVEQSFKVSKEIVEGAINDAEITKPSMRIAHRMSAGSFEKLLTDKRFKSVFETNHSGGAARTVDSPGDVYLYARRKYETDYNLRAPEDPELIHGFLEDTTTLGERASASNYGPFELILKPEVMDRSVYTFGDSARTRTAPYDTDSALIGEQVRNRLHQRANEKRNGDFYTEAITLGGLTIDDIEGVVISIGEKQGGETTRDKAGPRDITEVEQYIEQIKAKLPEAGIAVRIPAETLFPTKKVLELAQKYPDVQFMATIQEGLASTESPFRELSSPEATAQTSDNISIQNQKRAQASYNTAARRRDFLQQRIAERLSVPTDTKSLPQNITLHLTNRFY